MASRDTYARRVIGPNGPPRSHPSVTESYWRQVLSSYVLTRGQRCFNVGEYIRRYTEAGAHLTVGDGDDRFIGFESVRPDWGGGA